MRQLQKAAGRISDGEDKKCLQNERYGDQNDVQWIFDNHIAMEGEDQDQRQQKSDGCNTVKLFYKDVFKTIRAPFFTSRNDIRITKNFHMV